MWLNENKLKKRRRKQTENGRAPVFTEHNMTRECVFEGGKSNATYDENFITVFE